MNDKLAVKIFDELYDEDDLNELHKKKVIAQPIGFKLSTIAIIECELNAYHDRLAEENARLREFIEKQIPFLNSVSSQKAQQLLNQLKDQNNDK